MPPQWKGKYWLYIIVIYAGLEFKIKNQESFSFDKLKVDQDKQDYFPASRYFIFISFHFILFISPYQINTTQMFLF